MIIKNLFLEAPPEHIDSVIREMIRRWSEPLPTISQVLEVQEKCLNEKHVSNEALVLFDMLLQGLTLQKVNK